MASKLKSCWAILYFLKDRQFAILPPTDIIFDAFQPHGELHVDILPKTIKVLAKYDEEFYEAMIIQCALTPEHLQNVIPTMRKYKMLKHFKIEKLLDVFERYNSGRRTKVQPLEVRKCSLTTFYTN